MVGNYMLIEGVLDKTKLVSEDMADIGNNSQED
jgi:hypothetical protein